MCIANEALDGSQFNDWGHHYLRDEMWGGSESPCLPAVLDEPVEYFSLSSPPAVLTSAAKWSAVQRFALPL